MHAVATSVLVVIDPTTDEQPALKRATWLARKLGAALELFVCDYDPYLTGEWVFDTTALEKARRSLIDNHLRTLRKLAEQPSSEGVATSVDARWDRPLHDGILRKAHDSHASFIVKDTHYHPVLKRSIFSNTDWHLIRECTMPLLLVKPRELREPPMFLAAVDPLHEHAKPPELDRRIMSLTRDLCAASGGDYGVFHAFDPTPAFASSSESTAFPISSPASDIADVLRKRHADAVQALAEELDVPQAKLHLAEGATRETLIALVEKLHVDIVVMGAVSRAALQQLFVGSTAERVLDRLPCDLLIVKP